ncbi:MAG: M3 family oligoendopeptidase [Candidatus Promineofilum sp.]|nr:M3 family oligoendopeptidase [Promineifilum sp.]
MTQTMTPPRWSLDDLVAEPIQDNIDAALAALETDVAAFENRRERLREDMEAAELLTLLRQYEAIMHRGHLLGAYAYLRFSENTQDQTSLSIRDRLDQALTAFENRVLFFTLWLKAIPEEAAARLMPDDPDLRHFITSLRKFQPHTLTEPEERVINLKDTNGIDAMTNLYDMIVSAFSFRLEVDGKTKTLTRDELTAYFRHPSADIRAAAYQELYRVYAENSAVLAQIYSHRVRDWYAEGIGLRHFPTPMSVRNLQNDIPDQVVEALLEASRRNSGLFQRYFRLKAAWLGMDKLRRYDIYAPLAPADRAYDYADGMALVLDSLTHFDPRLAALVQRVIDADHVDAAPRPGKRGGAYCYSVAPELTPWVFSNYTGKARDVATMAHEMGHAIHGMLAANHSPLTFHASLPLAETASVFSEILLTNRLLKDETDPAVRRDLLAYALDDAYATVQRQAAFSLFEREAHALIQDGATAERVCAAYMDNLRAQFGDAIEIGDEFRWEWISVPHFYATPFYTYAYAFGQLLVLALYEQYKEEGEAFVPRYLKLLSYGGSAEPYQVLTEAGFDVATTEFWQRGYDALEAMLNELENL